MCSPPYAVGALEDFGDAQFLALGCGVAGETHLGAFDQDEVGEVAGDSATDELDLAAAGSKRAATRCWPGVIVTLPVVMSPNGPMIVSVSLVKA